MKIKIEQLIDENSKYFSTICKWQKDWWGIEHKEDRVIEFMKRCLNKDKIPMTYIAIKNDEVVGMYQIDMYDNIDVRPDYYPWLVNVYVDEKYRGQGICNKLMSHAEKTFKRLDLKRVYLHSKHINLYEKYGWVHMEDVEVFSGKIKRIYYIDVD